MNDLAKAFYNIQKKLRHTAKRTTRRISGRARSVAAKFTAMGRQKRITALAGGAAFIAVTAALVIVLCGSGAKGDTPPAKALSENPPAAQDNTVKIAVPTPTPTPQPTPVPTPTPVPDPTLKRGMECEEVRLLQIRLMELNFLDLDEPTLKFGPATEDAVRRFQRQVNFTDGLEPLQEDGIAGVYTLELIYSETAPKYIVKYGMQGDDISAVQEQLKDLGYMKEVTGNYGDKTVEALKSFQDRNDLSADGMCGEKTFELLYSDNAKESASKTKQSRTKANISNMISVAKKQLGDKYVLGAKGPDKFDCSGLVYYCLKEAGSNRRRLNAAGYSQVSDWQKIDKMRDLERGDLIFFYSDDFSKVGHVGIVMNSSEMIDASNSRGKVVRRDYTTNYWQKHFVCGRRPW